MMPTQWTIEKARAKLKREGLARTAYDTALRAINSILLFKILRGLVVSRPNPQFLECPRPYSAKFLSASMLRNYAADPVNDLSESFLEDALARGDECFAICDRDVLAAYGWYSIQPTRIDPPQFKVRFKQEYVYMYKGYTHPRYRGQRLHAFVITLGLQAYLARGFKGIVSYVESNNFNSLKSCARIGFESFGSVYLTKLFGRYLRTSSPGCKRMAFGIEAVPSERDHRAAPEDCQSVA